MAYLEDTLDCFNKFKKGITMKNILETILNNSNDNFDYLFKPFIKKSISYSQLNEFIENIEKLNLTTNKITKKMNHILNNRYLKYQNENSDIEKIWQKYPHLNKVKNFKILQKNSNYLSEEEFTKYYFNNLNNLDLKQGEFLFQNLISKNKKIFTTQSRLVIYDFLENPTKIKKDFLFQSGYNIEYVMDLITKTSLRNLNINKAFSTFLDYLSNELIDGTKNNSIRNTILDGVLKLSINLIALHPVWKNPPPVFNNKITYNEHQVLYGTGNGHGDNFNYMKGGYFVETPFKDIFLLPCLKFSGVQNEDIIKIIQIAASSKQKYSTDREAIDLYNNTHANKKLSSLKFSLHTDLIASLNYDDLNNKVSVNNKATKARIKI